MKKTVCIISFSEISRDSRVLREIEMARRHFKVHVIGYGAWQPPQGVRFSRLEKNTRSFSYLAKYYLLLISGRLAPQAYNAAFWLKPEYRQAADLIRQGSFDLIHANDWDSLPVAVEGAARTDTRILFDAHEFSPEQESNRPAWRVFVKPFKSYLFRRYLDKADRMITVSSGIRDLYTRQFRLTPQIILNTTAYQNTQFHPVRYDKINIVHHGHAIPGRYLEEMVRMIALTDNRYQLNFVLVSKDDDQYIQKLKKLAQSVAPNKVVFWEPVPTSEIINFIQRFDLGLPLLRVRQINHTNSLPNKFFDFIMAGLGILVSPLPSMMEVITANDIGKISASQTAADMAAMVNALSVEEINKFKRNSLKLAKVFNAEREMDKLLLIYRSLLNEQPAKISANIKTEN